jgi:hypothetical protein
MTPQRFLLALAAAFLAPMSGGLALAADVWTFDFGTPASKARPGFTKVTKASIFAPGKGHGFELVDGLLEKDHSKAYWWERKVHPTNPRLAKAGPARMTSYSTCDFVEGTADNAFLLAVPDGEYEVWAVASDPAEVPPFFEIHANGELKHRVRLGRQAFVFMEPFRARAKAGTLRIDLRSQHGWLLSALVVGTPGDEVLGKTIADMERDIFFEYPEHLKNWKQVKQTSLHPPPTLTAEEQARGYAVFARDYTTKVYPFTNPRRREIDGPLTAFATPGEFEPATAAVYPLKDLGAVEVSVSDFATTDGARIPRAAVKMGIVRCWRQRKEGGTGAVSYYGIDPELIEPPEGRRQLVKAGETKQWWFTVRVPADAKPGRYRAQVTFRPANAPSVRKEWRLLVLPFKLTRPKDRHWGTWFDQFPPMRGLRGPVRRGRNTPAETDRLARLEMQDYRDHGFDVAILPASYSIRVSEADGGFSYDISGLRKQMDYLKLLGGQSVVPITLEYLCRRLEYRYADEPKDKHVAGTFSTKARDAIVGLVRHLEAERQRSDWPQFLYMPIDEPANNKTENRMIFGAKVLEMVQSVPGAQTGCTITARGVQQLGKRINTRLYAYGHVSRETARRDATQGFPYWYYRNGIMYGSSTVLSRNYTGFEFLRSGAECATGWGFTSYHANPYNDLDGRHRDWSVVLPGADGPIPTIYWELCREGVDDARYVATLQSRISRLGELDPQAVARAQAVLKPLLDSQAEPLTEPGAFHRHRWQLAREILNLTGTTDLAPPLAFIPTVSASQLKAKIQANVIENPSFENEPQPDGLPGWPYPHDDPYTKLTGKPTGAISVSDELAHDGNRSLKWDFRKSAGKGSKYGNSSYLIINVQVAKEVTQSLRGKRVQIGMWVRLGGGNKRAPGMKLRMFGTRDGKYGYLSGVECRGGIEDAAVWNRYEAEGFILPGTEKLDIHIFSRIPKDPKIRDETVFYLDEISLRPFTPVPVTLTSPLDEVYTGEPLTWHVSVAEQQPVTVALLRGAKVLQQDAVAGAPEPQDGHFPTEKLAPGVYRLRATAQGKTAWRDVIVATDPFAW